MRFLLALAAAKITAMLIRIVDKERGTNLPGQVAMKIDPQFVAHIKNVNPRKAVFITGTNGKSTTTKLLNEILSHSGRKVCSNLGGANMLTGVATALAANCSLTGKLQAEYIVMETDERYLAQIRHQLPARYQCVTNVQKDQAQRNGEPSYIVNKIAQALDPSVVLFVNQNEPRSYVLKDLVERYVTYGVEVNSLSFDTEDDFFALSVPCPKCHDPLVFGKYNIAHIGPFHCPSCGFGADGTADFLATDIDYENKHFTVKGQKYAFNFNTPYFLYCYTSAIAMATELGLTQQEIAAALADFQDIQGRLVTRKIGEKTLHYIKMKQENSETLQSGLNLVSRDRQKKGFLIGYDEALDFYPPFIIAFYLFDADFGQLYKSGVTNWMCMSPAMGKAAALRLLYDGFNEDNLVILPDSHDEAAITEAVSKFDCDTVYLIDEIPYFMARREA